ncbi:MAG: protein kinase [Myxococcaceae bacterium]
MRNHGVGALFEAQDSSGTGRVALREIPLEAMGEMAVNALGRLPHHPVLPNVIGSGRDGDNAWVALEFPAGKLLSSVGRALDPLSWARVGSAVASALAAAHESEVVHGELSNDSVLIAGERVLLYDLPLVVANRLTDRRSEARLLALLPQLISYLSPERIRGDEPSPASDVYSLGVLLCIAAGSEQAPGATALERIHRVSTLAWRPALPPHLVPQHALLNRMLAADPAKRPAMSEVAAELNKLLAQMTAPVPRHAITEPNRAADPFEALIANGVSVNAPDPHAIPTRQGVPGQGELVSTPAPGTPAPTAPARGQALAAVEAERAARVSPPQAARKSPPKITPQIKTPAPTQMAAPAVPAPLPLPTEPGRAAAPTPNTRRRTPVPPMVDALNDTGKQWVLEPPQQQQVQRPAVQRTPSPVAVPPQPAPVAAAPAAAPLLIPAPLTVNLSPQTTMPFGYSEITYKQGVIIDTVGHQALEQLPMVSGELVELAPMNEAQQLTNALAAPEVQAKPVEAYINPESFDETDEVKPSEVVESDDELAAKLKPSWKRASVIIPLAAVLVMGIAGVAVWQFAPDIVPSFELPKVASLMPASSGGSAEDATDEAPRRRRTARPTSMPTAPAVPAEVAEAKAEEPKAEEPAAVEAKEEPKAEPQIVAEAKPEPVKAEVVKAEPAPEPVKAEEPAKVAPPPAKQQPVAKARPAPAPAPAPAQKKVAASSKTDDTPAIDAKPKGAPSKLGDDDP